MKKLYVLVALCILAMTVAAGFSNADEVKQDTPVMKNVSTAAPAVMKNVSTTTPAVMTNKSSISTSK